MIPVVSFAERAARLRSLFRRGATFDPEMGRAVRRILDGVRQRGDEALREYTLKFDGAEVDRFEVDPDLIEEAGTRLDGGLREVVTEAMDNIRRFHEHQVRETWYVEDGDGVVLGQRIVPIARAGLYVPGGTAFYPSSLLMNVIPAQVAGVEELIVATPPGKNGRPSELVMACAHLLGVRRLFAVGGAQAIAAMAFGTESVPRVDKITGPGNAYVALAKKMVFGEVDIDSIAGPSEIVVLADATADAEFVAADMLSQAEHDERASSVLVTPCKVLARSVCENLERMAAGLPRRKIIERSLRDYGAIIVTDTIREALAVVNELAPEHLEIIVDDPWRVMEHIRHAGAIFLGPYSPESVGDYFAGPNHVLPTGGTARYASALGVDDFVRRQSVISYTEQRLRKTGRSVIAFARAEQLEAHALAVDVRMKRIGDAGA
jgi:histidinol dehydrogenase